MGLVPRAATMLAATLVACAFAAGCGGSVADADGREPTRAAPPASSPFCVAAQQNVAAVRPLSALITRGGGSPEELTNTIDGVRRAGAAMLNSAPDEIHDDVQLTVDSMGLQLDALLANGGNGAAVARDPQLNARLAAPELAAARERVQAYVNESCGALPGTGR